MNHQLHTNLLVAARRLIRVAYEPADELLSEDDNWDQVSYAMALLRCQVQAVDLEAITAERDALQEHTAHLQQALERTGHDREQLQSINAELRERLVLSQHAARHAQSNYASERIVATNGVRVGNAWQCFRCGEYTCPSETNTELCESCEILRQQIIIEQLAAHQGGDLLA